MSALWTCTYESPKLMGKTHVIKYIATIMHITLYELYMGGSRGNCHLLTFPGSTLK